MKVMPNKTIYIKDSDAEIWDKAQKKLGGESISSIMRLGLHSSPSIPRRACRRTGMMPRCNARSREASLRRGHAYPRQQSQSDVGGKYPSAEEGIRAL